jgi:hypothetical protein
VTLEIHEFSNIEDIFEICKRWINDFLALGSLKRKGFDSVTPYMHCLVYHYVPFFTKKYGKLIRFSGQGVEKINDDIKIIHHSKTNKWDVTVDALQVRKKIEHLTSENCVRDKRNYTKITNEHWSDIIFRQRAAKKAKMSEEMSLVADKYSENDPVPYSIDNLSVFDYR